MLKSFRRFAAVGIFLSFAIALLSMGVMSALPNDTAHVAHYVKSKHLGNRQLAHRGRRTLSSAAIFEQEGDLPTKDTEPSNLFKKSSVPEIALRTFFDNQRAYGGLRVVLAPKVSMQIFQSVLIL